MAFTEKKHPDGNIRTFRGSYTDNPCSRKTYNYPADQTEWTNRNNIMRPLIGPEMSFRFDVPDSSSVIEDMFIELPLFMAAQYIDPDDNAREVNFTDPYAAYYCPNFAVSNTPEKVIKQAMNATKFKGEIRARTIHETKSILRSKEMERLKQEGANGGEGTTTTHRQ